MSTSPTVDKNDPANWVDAKADGTCTNYFQQVVPSTISDSATRKAIEDSRTAGASDKPPAGGDFGCSASGFTSSEGFAVCVAALVYYIGPGLASNVAYVAAYFFSYTISLSLNSVAYALDFLSSGWTTVRDLANMAFILILVYIAFMIMFQAETTGTIRMLAGVIFIALIINFSFFLTRVVIDAGNILSVQFYNAIPQGASLPGTQTAQISAFGGSGVKDLSDSIMKAVNIQSLFSQDSFTQARTASGGSIMGGLIVLTLVYLSVAVMFWILFFVFLQVGIKFLFRIVVLWFIIISAPLALVAKAVPQESAKKYYDMWQNYLIKFSFYPAIFLFIYLIMVKFIQQMLGGQSGNLVSTIFNSGTMQGAVANQSATLTVASAVAQVSIRMGFIVAMFYIALKASDWIVTEGSNAAANITGRLTGAALGTVGFGGRLGGAIVRRNTRDLVDSKYAAGRALWRAGNFLGNRTFDLRNVPGTSRALGTLGGDLVKGRTLNTGKGTSQTANDVMKKAENFESLVLDRETSEAEIKDRKELNDRVAAVKAREDSRRMGELNAHNVAETESESQKTEKEIKRRDSLTTKMGLGPLVKREHEELSELMRADLDTRLRTIEERKKSIAATEKKTWDELKQEHGILAKRTENLSTAQVTAMNAGDIEKIVKQLSESHLKAIKESGKFNAQIVSELTKKWHEENKKSPMMKSMEELDKLDKIHEKLEDMKVDIDTVKERGTTPGGDVVISLKAAKDTKEAIEGKKEEWEATKEGSSGKTRQDAQLRLNELNKAIKRIDAVIENLEKVPEKVGNRDASGEYEIKKT